MTPRSVFNSPNLEQHITRAKALIHMGIYVSQPSEHANVLSQPSIGRGRAKRRGSAADKRAHAGAVTGRDPGAGPFRGGGQSCAFVCREWAVVTDLLPAPGLVIGMNYIE